MKNKIQSLPGIDVNEGLCRIGNSIENYQAILTSFLINYRNVSASLNTGNDYTDLYELIHRLYSVSAMIGATPLSELCLNFLEQPADSRYEPHLDNIRLELGKVIQGLAANTSINSDLNENDPLYD